MQPSLAPASLADDESSDLQRKFLESELTFYSALAEKAVLHYSSGRFKAARKARSVAEAGYHALRRYVSQPHFALSLAGAPIAAFMARMADLAERLSSLSSS